MYSVTETLVFFGQLVFLHERFRGGYCTFIIWFKGNRRVFIDDKCHHKNSNENDCNKCDKAYCPFKTIPSGFVIGLKNLFTHIVVLIYIDDTTKDQLKTPFANK